MQLGRIDLLCYSLFHLKTNIEFVVVEYFFQSGQIVLNRFRLIGLNDNTKKQYYARVFCI